MSDAARLLDPAFVRELEALRRQLNIDARGGASGERRSSKRGGSAEFADHRAYAPGDDIRRIDWMAFARTGEPVVKLFHTEEDVVVRLVLDTSKSMAFGSPAKLEVARRLAAAIAYLTLAGGERAQVVSALDGSARMAVPLRGKGALVSVLRALDESKPDGATHLARSIESVLSRSPRPGMLVLFSDFFDPSPLAQAVSHARTLGHDVALVHVLAGEEAAPTLEGDLTLVDDETGVSLDLTVDESALRAYRATLAGLVENLRALARRVGGSYVLVRTDEAWQPAVRRFVQRAVDAP